MRHKRESQSLGSIFFSLRLESFYFFVVEFRVILFFTMVEICAWAGIVVGEIFMYGTFGSAVLAGVFQAGCGFSVGCRPAGWGGGQFLFFKNFLLVLAKF